MPYVLKNPDGLYWGRKFHGTGINDFFWGWLENINEASIYERLIDCSPSQIEDVMIKVEVLVFEEKE